MEGAGFEPARLADQFTNWRFQPLTHPSAHCLPRQIMVACPASIDESSGDFFLAASSTFLRYLGRIGSRQTRSPGPTPGGLPLDEPRPSTACAWLTNRLMQQGGMFTGEMAAAASSLLRPRRRCSLAEGEGFEPPGPYGSARFRSGCVQPDSATPPHCGHARMAKRRLRARIRTCDLQVIRLTGDRTAPPLIRRSDRQEWRDLRA